MTGGGTGGHVNPAIAIADTIRENVPDAQIAFVGTDRGIENKLVPDAGYPLLIAVWGIAAAGMLFKLCWVTCPKYLSSIIYVAMGWACLSVFGQLIHTLSHAAFSWLLAGGLFYTVGGIIYALRLPFFNARHRNFGSHEIFHLFVMAGSICHFICMYRYVL